MNPIFKLEVNGSILVGISADEENHFNYDGWEIVPHDKLGYTVQSQEKTCHWKYFTIIGLLSKVTEEMAKEWGFEAEYLSSKEDMIMRLWAAIHYAGTTRIVGDDLSNILLIFDESKKA